MNSETITKINKLGRIGQIVARIVKVVLVVGFLVSLLIFAALLHYSNSNWIKFRFKEEAILEIDKNRFGNIFIESALEKVGTEQSFFESDGLKYYVSGVADKGDCVIIDTYAESPLLNTKRTILVFGITILQIVSAYIAVHLLSLLCKEFKNCETPFSEEIVKWLNRFAVSLIPLGLLHMAMNSLAAWFTSGEISIKIELLTISLIIMILLLTSIFRYGAMLQQESDETL